MAKYIVYDNTLGTATARPIVAVFECDPSELSNQQSLLPANETAVAAPADFQYEDNHRDDMAGTATGGTSTTISDSGQNWQTNCFTNMQVRIDSGTGAGQQKTITSNTATALTISGTWSPIPDATSNYRIVDSIIKFEYTYNTSTQVITRSVALRDTLAQRQERVKNEISEIKTRWLPNITGYRKFGDTRFQDWVQYIQDLDAVTSQGIFATAPEYVTWPTQPSDTDDDTVYFWNRNYRRGNIRANVGMLLGVPTGGIFESGSNANGNYEKFANGMMWCWANVASAAGSDVTWTYPAAFTTTPRWWGFVGQGTDCIVTRSATASTSTTLSFRSWQISATPTIARVTVSTHLFAWGPWV